MSLYGDYKHSFTLSKEYDKEFFDTVGDLYFTGEVQGMKIYPQHATVNRLDHITSVTYLSYVVCGKLGLDRVSAARGAVLHDLFYYDWHDGDWSHRPHGYRHPGFAAENAKILNPALTKKEENIIRRHMWPLTVLPPSSPEGFVVSLCDKYCATAELIRAKREKMTEKHTPFSDKSKGADER